MAEIDSLGANYYYSGVQNASNEAIKRNTKKEEVRKAGNTKNYFKIEYRLIINTIKFLKR